MSLTYLPSHIKAGCYYAKDADVIAMQCYVFRGAVEAKIENLSKYQKKLKTVQKNPKNINDQHSPQKLNTTLGRQLTGCATNSHRLPNVMKMKNEARGNFKMKRRQDFKATDHKYHNQ